MIPRPCRLWVLLLALLSLCPPSAVAAQPDVTLPATDDGLPGTGPIVRDDWFKKLWETRRAKWATEVEKDQGAVVFLGDSITQGWGDDMKKAFGDLKVANRGISGDTTRGVLLRLEQDVLSLKPKAIVMLIGTNDLGRGAEPETPAANLKLILAAMKKHDEKMPIVLCAVMPRGVANGPYVEKVKKLNALYADLVWGDRQVTPVDTWTLFAEAEGGAPKALFPDLLHPNPAGYEKWAGAVRPILATLGLIETGPDDFKLEEGYESLFNGKDLTGWMIKANAKPDAKETPTPHGKPGKPIFKEDIDLTGKTVSPDLRYAAINGRLVVTTPIEGRRFQQMWTTRVFPKDFTLKLEFRASPNADSGVFIRQPQLQCRDYPLAGPYTMLKNYRQGDWNELVVVVKGGVAHCTCNGEVIEEQFKLPATGPIGLEGDRGQMEYRRIRVKEEK